jgi:MFS family permease
MQILPAMPAAYWRTWVPSFLFFAAYYALLIPLPLYLTECRLADWQVALILGAFGVASVLSRPFAGVLADSLGRRPLLLFGAALFAAGAVAVTWTHHPAALFLLRVIQIIGYVSFTTAATAKIADVVAPSQRGGALAIFGISINLAMTTAPALVGYGLATLTTRGAFWLSGGLAAAAGVLSLPLRDSTSAAARPSSWWRDILAPPALWVPMMAAVLFGIGFGAFLQFLPLVADRRGLGSAGSGYAVYGISIVATRLLTGRWQDGRYRHRLLQVGFPILAAGLCLLAIARSFAVLGLAAFVLAVAAGILHPGIIATHVENMPEDERGRAVGNCYLAFDLGIGFGPWLLAPSLSYLGLHGLYFTAAVFSLLGTAAVSRFSAASAGA